MGLISNGTTIFDAGALDSGLAKGDMTFIKKLTASGSGTLSFVDGASGVVLDDTYKEYLFTFNNIHPSVDGAQLKCNFSVDSGSNYNVAKTTTSFFAENPESGDSDFGYNAGKDEAEATGDMFIFNNIGNDADQSGSGHMTLYNPSSTTFVKNFLIDVNEYQSGDTSVRNFKSGYGNTTSAIDAVIFRMNSGNIDAGVICLYGIS
jgi:hypothetical protein